MGADSSKPLPTFPRLCNRLNYPKSDDHARVTIRQSGRRLGGPMLLAAAVIYACALNARSSIEAAIPVALTATREYHVRALDPRVREWISLGAMHSRTFSDLLNHLTKSDLIVYVQIVDSIPGGAAGQTAFVTSTDTARYLRIELAGGGSLFEMVSLLGHELQHAVEIADAPRVRTSRGLATMYLQAGGTSTRYDSAAARLTGERVRDELAWSYGSGRDRSGVRTPQ